jgi:hypothetical protein
MPVVRPEFGPTLPQLAGPRLRRLPVALRVAVAAAATLLLVLIAVLLLRDGGRPGQRTVVVREPVAFNFIYRAPFTRLRPQGDELVRVGRGTQRFTVAPLRLPAYRGDVSSFLPLYAGQIEQRLGRELPGYVTRGDGRANVNRVQGYEINYQYRPGGKLTFVRQVLLPTAPDARDGVLVTVQAQADRTIPNADSVGHNGALKTSLRSFRFGTERP